MNKKLTRLCAMLLALVMAMSFGVSALDYGQEWAGASGSAAAGYADVPANHWAWDSIQRVSAKSWFGGYPDGTFRPNGTITRAEALKVFVVFLGLQVSPVSQTGFYDVAANAWYAPYVEAGKDLFPVRTTVQGKTPFQPDMPVTREDTVYALVNALGYGNDMGVVDQSVLNMFKDQNSISRNLRPYFAVALKNQLVSGYTDGTIRAQNSLTRAEFATLLYRGSFVGHNDSFTAKISSVTPFPNGATNMAVGETLSLSARAAYTDGTNQAYTDLQPYIASGSDVISLSGISVTALKEGTATIGFNDSHLKAQTITITVKAPTDVPVLKITDYVATTEAATVSVAGTVSDANLSTLSLTCGGKDIIPGSNGSFQTVVSLNVGVNTITFVATNQYGVTAQKSITVTRTEPVKETIVQAASISLSQTSVSLTKGDTTQLSAIVSPANVTDPTVMWSSSGTSVATVNSSGIVTAVGVGNAVITAKCGTVSATCNVAVTAPAQTSAPTTNTDHQTNTNTNVFHGIVVYKTGNEAKVTAGPNHEYITVAAVIDGMITTTKLIPALYASLAAGRFYAYTDGLVNEYGVYYALTTLREGLKKYDESPYAIQVAECYYDSSSGVFRVKEQGKDYANALFTPIDRMSVYVWDQYSCSLKQMTAAEAAVNHSLQNAAGLVVQRAFDFDSFGHYMETLGVFLVP